MRIMPLNFIFFVALLTSACLLGCTAPKAPAAKAQAAVHPTANKAFTDVSAVQKLKISDAVAVQGIMVEKCPIAGCWFKLHDKTGTIKVDLKATTQTVINVPLNSNVTVRGKVVNNGTEKMIQASSATF